MQSMWKLTINAKSEQDAIDQAKSEVGFKYLIKSTEVTRIYEVVVIKDLNEEISKRNDSVAG